MSTMLETLRASLKAQLDQREAHELRVDEIVSSVEARADQSLTAEESTEITELRSKVTVLDASRVELEASIAAAEARGVARVAAEQLSATLPTAALSTAGGQVVVRSNEATYRPGGEHSFLADLYARDMNRGETRQASERIQRNEAEVIDAYRAEKRDIIVSTMAGAIPPKFLLDQFSAIVRGGRPFLNALNSQQLPPDFLTTVIPRGTTGSLAGPVTEGSGFIEQDIAVINDTPTVQLIGAQQDVSRALFERGGYVVDGIIFPDLLAAAELSCDLTAIQGRNATTSILGPLAVSGINAVAYTDGTPTVPELWPKLMDAIQRVNSTRFMPATAIFMHPRRWGFITAAIDNQNRPLFNFSTILPTNLISAGIGDAATYGQIVGSLGGLPVITDASMPTTWLNGAFSLAGTEDVILIARTTDFVLWEDPIMRFTFEQAPTSAPGQVRLAAGRFILAHFNRFPTGISTVSGTGLTPPAF